MIEQSCKKQRLTSSSSTRDPPPLLVELEEDPEGSDYEEEWDGDSVSDETEESDAEESDGSEEEEEEEEEGKEVEESDDGEAEEDGIESQPSNDRTITLTLTDPDVLNCPICFEDLEIPVYQCLNGHIACDSCRQKVNQKCSTCSQTIECRCLAIEKIFEAAQIACANLMYGCKYMMKYSDKLEHEDVCDYTGCSCPVHGWDFVDSASNLYQHFGTEHKHNGKVFDFNGWFGLFIDRNPRLHILRESTSSTVFVLNQFNVHEMSAVSVVVIAPKASTGKYRCELEVEDGETSFSMESAVESIPNLVDYNPAKYLLVFGDIIDPSGKVLLQIRIQQA